jgi:hypothetical protein
VLAVMTAAAAAVAAPAGATNECRGLQTCVPVAGPWVVAASSLQIQYQLQGPPRFIVGGLDAELSDRGLDVGFVGALGSPVNPGITTSTAAVFLGRLVHGRNPAAVFRPHIGCVPASGGGQRTPTAFHPFPPGKPSIRRTSEIRALPGRTRSVVARCAPNEELSAATYAIGFYGDTPPSAALVRALAVKQDVHAGRVHVSVHATHAVALARAVVQVDLVCAPGR